MNTYKCARINCALFYSLMKLSNDEFSSYKKNYPTCYVCDY